MPALTDPMNGLRSLQVEYPRGTVPFQPCELSNDLRVTLDYPLGSWRYTYARIVEGKVLGMVSFVQADPVDGVPCVSIAYAVDEKERGRGLAQSMVPAAIAELRNGLQRAGVGKFYVEAIVGEDNVPSQRIAGCFLSESPTAGTDSFSGVPIKQYLLLVE